MNSKINKYKIIATSPIMLNLLKLIRKVAKTTATVLIQGETGTGKELIARYIYENSLLKDKPFIIENCGALSNNLVESEWFGHKKGAFTGAIEERKGLFEIANGGTIFLDEIGEIPYHIQTKLLRVLEEGEFRAVGSNKYKKVHVRIIASTNKELEKDVKNGIFRKDLFYRLNVFQITLPPLRKRKEDIIPLADHFLSLYSQKINIKKPTLDDKVKSLLINFNWPGNVRELKNEMEKAIILANGKSNISENEISEHIKSFNILEKFNNKVLSIPSIHIKNLSLKTAIEQLEVKMLKEVLEKTKGNKSKAARLLGITRQGLLNKIARYGLEFIFIICTFSFQIINSYGL